MLLHLKKGVRDEKLKEELHECRVIYAEGSVVKEIMLLKLTPHEYKNRNDLNLAGETIRMSHGEMVRELRELM